MTLLDQFNEMLQAHNDFIQSMSGIAYGTNNKEMQDVIFAHTKRLRAILDEEPTPRIPEPDHTDLYQGDGLNIVGDSYLS